jgi:hypothetical protein
MMREGKRGAAPPPAAPAVEAAAAAAADAATNNDTIVRQGRMHHPVEPAGCALRVDRAMVDGAMVDTRKLRVDTRKLRVGGVGRS